MDERKTKIYYRLLTLLGIVLTIGVIYFTWPYCLIYFAMTAAYYYTKNQKDIFLKAAHSILTPVTIGFAVFMTILLLVNLFHSIQPSNLMAFEQWMIDLRLSTKSWLNISTFQFILILIGLLAITMFLPRLQAVSRFMKLYKVVQYSFVALTVITSFTFFAQIPADNLIEAEHERNYEAFIKSEEQIGRYIAAKALRKKVELFSTDEKYNYARIFSSIKSRFPSSVDNNFDKEKEAALELIHSIAIDFTEQASLNKTLIRIDPRYTVENKSTVEGGIPDNYEAENLRMEEVPISIEERKQQLELLSKRRIEEKKIKLKTDEILKATQHAFLKYLSEFFVKDKELNAIKDIFIEKVVKEYAKRLFKNNIVKNLNIKGNIEQVVRVLSNSSTKITGGIASPNLSTGIFNTTSDEIIDEAIGRKLEQILKKVNPPSKPRGFGCSRIIKYLT